MNHMLKLATLLGLLSAPLLVAQSVTVQIDQPMNPPAWALMERQLLRANSRAVEAFAAKYLDDRGYILHTPRWGTLDGTDDAIETFANWTLLHALGASDSVLQLYQKGLEGHLRQYKTVRTTTTEIAKDGCYYKEFMPMSDWHHNGEGMQGFFFLGLSAPNDQRLIQRMKRFSGFYMNEDPEAPNYDPKYKVIRSLWTGSKGPLLRKATQQDWTGDFVDGRFHILHSAGGRLKMYSMKDVFDEMLAHFNDYLPAVGDHPLNLIATMLPVNSYMLTGEQKYKDWLLEYVNAWTDRTNANGGNIPTNIGLDGSIGGEWGGKWYGGTYGWSFSPWSPEFKERAHRNMFDKGAWPGFGNALLVSGDQRYVDVLRRQLDNMYAAKKVVDGRLMIPHNYGDQGWYNWTPDLFVDRLTEVYLWSMKRSDLERIPHEGWIGYLEGKEPGYPEKALRKDFERIRMQMEEMRNDPTTPDTRLADWAMDLNPATTDTLVNLMLGGYLTNRVYSLHCRARYFDPAGQRAGPPEDVAALVEKILPEETVLTLVNVSPVEERTVGVQMGGYAEHQSIAVTIGGKTVPVNSSYFKARLAPGAGATLRIAIKRYANQPTLRFPWER